jgi:hypothetical protein
LDNKNISCCGGFKKISSFLNFSFYKKMGKLFLDDDLNKGTRPLACAPFFDPENK